MVDISGEDRIDSLRLRVLYRLADLVGDGFKCLSKFNIVIFPVVNARNSEFLHILLISANILFYCQSTSFRKGPVTDWGLAASSSGVPVATTYPPFRPPSGPMSIR